MGSPSGAIFSTRTSSPTRTPMSMSLLLRGPIAPIPAILPFSPGLSIARFIVLPPHHDLHRHSPADRDPRLVDLDQEGPASLVVQHFHLLPGPDSHVLHADGGAFPALAPAAAAAGPVPVLDDRDLFHHFRALPAREESQRKHI